MKKKRLFKDMPSALESAEEIKSRKRATNFKRALIVILCAALAVAGVALYLDNDSSLKRDQNAVNNNTTHEPYSP